MGQMIPGTAPAVAADRWTAGEVAINPSDSAQALAFMRAGLDWLASTDRTDLTGAERADCLRALKQAESVHLAATARIVSAFDAAEDYVGDGQGGTRAWLRWQTRLTRQAAATTTAWTRRLTAHPTVARALA